MRNDVANCSEKAYESLSLKGKCQRQSLNYLTTSNNSILHKQQDAQQIMFFDDSGKLTKYIAESKPDWQVKDGRIFFKAAEAQKSWKSQV